MNLSTEFWVGPNYWPAHAGIRMWSDWRPALVLADLNRMVELGFTVNRSFLFMPDFIPTAKGVEPVMVERFIEFLSLCEQAGIKTLPSFFVGHMSGEDWDVAWRQNKNFFTDPGLLVIEKMYIQTIVTAAKESIAVAGWIATNEIFNYESNSTAVEFAEWGKKITDWVKAIDPVHPVSLGEGARGPETNRRLPNFETRKCIDYLDFIGLHYYPRPGNRWHQSFTTAFRVNIAQFWNLPVIIEEFGHSTTMGSLKNQADYYRTVLHSALINGAVGTLNWCYSDFDLYSDRPYIHHPFETRFGLVKTDGSLRPAGEVMSQFASLAQEMNQECWKKISPTEIGLMVPSNYYYKYPHDYDREFSDWYPLYLDVFSNLKRANLNPRLLLEPAVEIENDGRLSHLLEIDPQKYPVLIFPRLKRITAVFWQTLLKYVEAGGTLYASFAQDHWLLDWEEILGIESDLNFGLPVHRNWDTLELYPTPNWQNGDITKYKISLKNNKTDFAYCPILSTSAETLFEDQAGNPVLICQERGQGRIYYSTYPLEIIGLANPDEGTGQFIQNIYKYLWDQHGLEDIIRCSGQDLEFGIWENLETDRLKIIVLNHSDMERKGTLVFSDEVMDNPFPNNVIMESPNKMTFHIDGKNVSEIELQLSMVEAVSVG